MSTAQPRTLCEAFQRTAAIDPDAIAVRTVGGTQTITWAEYADQARQVAAGLAALGVGRGDTVTLMMANRVEFYPIDVGAQHLGAISFSAYNTLTAEQLNHVFGNADTKVVICEAQYVEKVLASGVPIAHIVTLDGAVRDTIPLAELMGMGSPEFDFAAAWQAVQPDDIATLIYTSGTTGNPKGVESTHANLLAEATAVQEILEARFGDRITSYLPSAHIADRFTALYAQMVRGTQITVVPDVRMIAAAIPDCRPTIWGAVPRVWEKLKIAIEMAAANDADPERRKGMEWALDVARRVGAHALDRTPVPAELAAEHARAEAAVLSKVRAMLGLAEVRWAISGAAPIPPETLGFFAGIGVPITEIWGMSELTCIASGTSPADTRLGTVGKIVPGMEARIADDGELLVRGPLVMRGYRKDPVQTAEAIDPDGWLHTGDVATIDEDGFITIIDRKKELIINAAGKNMSPANIENSLKAACPLAGPIVAIGDGRPYNTALITLDAEAAAGYAARNGLPDASPAALAADPGLLKLIADGVAAGNAKLSRVEQIKRFQILPTFWEPGSDEITLTMKLKRKPIAKKYAAEIDQLYAPTPAGGVHEAAPAPS